MMRQTVILVTVCALGCEVSLFGGEPVSVFGAQPPTSGSEGRCGEPEEARRARTSSAGPDDACVERCVLLAGAVDGTCSAITPEPDGSLRVRMRSADGLVLQGSMCPADAFVLSDASGVRSADSDDPSSSHDAQVQLRNGTLRLLPTHGSPLSTSEVTNFAGECIPRTLELSDSVVYSPDLERGLCGTSMLRIDPPTDAQGRPDSFWHLRFEHPPERLEVCFY